MLPINITLIPRNGIIISHTSIWAITIKIPQLLLPTCIIILPFITADWVVRDFRYRTYEMIMTTSIITWIHIFGRFLASLIVCFGLALLMLIAILVVGFITMLVQGYPRISIVTTTTVWAVTVLPAIVVVNSVIFTLCSLFPYNSNWIKGFILFAWLSLSLVTTFYQKDLPWYALLDPSSTALAKTIDKDYLDEYYRNVRNTTNNKQDTEIIRSLEQRIPNLQPWILPHLLLLIGSILPVAIISRCYRRLPNNLR